MAYSSKYSSSHAPLAALGCLLLLIGCEAKQAEPQNPNKAEKPTAAVENPAPPTTSEPAEQQQDSAPADPVGEPQNPSTTQGTAGTITGVAKWVGAPFKQKPIPGAEGADRYCDMMHKKSPLLSEKLIVNPNNTVKDVFVYVKSGLPTGKTWPLPEPMVLDQKGCRYEPHVFGIMVGQELKVTNSDSTGHNINAQPKNNQGFNIGQPGKGMEFTKTFGTRELMFKIKCDIHSWMGSYCTVLDHPFFATTDQMGNFVIAGLPDGEYVISTWHERFKKGREQTVVIQNGATKAVEFTFKRPAPKKKDS